ncbi:MAG: DUF4422 domain-containing protein [Erysipelotrichaceae bacterium]|nr:DUF4422 domain-containing protein [Erysipelotrichaceae bacterium]
MEDKTHRHIIIAVIAHKPYPMPEDPIYVPLEVGAANRKEHFFPVRDDQGDNISEKNPSYCELTGFYYAYKNLSCDVLGFDHYRRLFVRNGLFVSKNRKNALTGPQIDKILQKYDFIVPKKRHYYIETNESHYVHAHKREALDKTREIIARDYPDFLPAFDHCMKKRSGHYFNMFIARYDQAKAYLDWMFSILFALEKEIDLSTYEGNEKRVFGFVSELLLDVYLEAKHLTYKNQNYRFLEKQHWGKKILGVLKRKKAGERK